MISPYKSYRIVINLEVSSLWTGLCTWCTAFLSYVYKHYIVMVRQSSIIRWHFMCCFIYVCSEWPKPVLNITHDLHMNGLWVSIAVFLYRNDVSGPCLSQRRHGAGSRVGPKCCSCMGGTSIFWCDWQFNRFWNKDLQNDFCESCIRCMLMLWSVA